MVFKQLFALHIVTPAASILWILKSSTLLLRAIQKGTEFILSVGLYQLYTHLHIQCKGSGSLGVAWFGFALFLKEHQTKKGWTYRTWVLTHPLAHSISEGSASQTVILNCTVVCEHTTTGLNQSILMSYTQGKLRSRNCGRGHRINKTKILLPHDIHNAT